MGIADLLNLGEEELLIEATLDTVFSEHSRAYPEEIQELRFCLDNEDVVNPGRRTRRTP